jgi:hypothetical protein
MNPFARALPFAILLAAGTAAAEPRHMSGSGSSLEVATPCARHVTIDPDPSLSGQVSVDATADNPEELAQLVLTSGDSVKLRGPTNECWRPDNNFSFEPTLAITIRVPPHFSIAIDESGSGDYQIGPAGALAVDLSGSGKLQAESVTTLTVDISGSGRLAIAHANGAAHVGISGSGAIDIAEGTLPDLNLDISGSGEFRQRAGTVAKLKVDASGSGSVRVDGTVGDASVGISGSGGVDIAKLAGSISKEVDGSGEVRIGSR